MSYWFSNSSKSQLATVDQRLRLVAHKAIKIVDFTVIEGLRTKERQQYLFDVGKSKVQWPDSKHNVEDPDQYAGAYDLAPYPVDWAEMPDLTKQVPVAQLKEELWHWGRQLARFYYLAGVIKGIALEHGVSIRWGGDWDSDNDFNDQAFNDLVHFEIND